LKKGHALKRVCAGPPSKFHKFDLVDKRKGREYIGYCFRSKMGGESCSSSSFAGSTTTRDTPRRQTFLPSLFVFGCAIVGSVLYVQSKSDSTRDLRGNSAAHPLSLVESSGSSSSNSGSNSAKSSSTKSNSNDGRKSSARGKSSSSSSSSSDNSGITWTLARVNYDPPSFYKPGASEVYSYKFLEGTSAVIEPYAPMYLVVFDDEDDTKNAYYSFSICSTKKFSSSKCDVGYLYSSSKKSDVTPSISCSPHDDMYVTVTKYDKNDNVIAETDTVSAKCIYIRRELRQLTDDDRDAALDAMYEMWEVSESTGQKKYGDDYHASTYFTEAHHFNAAWQDGDHIHEGLGFLPQHLKITNMFEASMQAVDPSTSLFYWDFTIENEAGVSIYDSDMFTSETFGTLSEPKNKAYWSYEKDDIDDGKIPNGRWKKIKADTTRFDDIPSPFGYLRGPWNMNPSKYVTRFTSEVTSLPGCAAYYQWASISDFQSFLEIAPYLPHASLHGAIGGVFGCDAFDDLLDKGLILDETSKVMICSKWGFYLKELYRYNYITPNENCKAKSMDPDDISCGFTCNEDLYSGMAAMMKKTVNNAYTPTAMSADKWEDWRDFVCSGDGFRVFVGDQLESASPSDPSFWPIHPTQERLLHAKLMSGGFDKFSWPDDATKSYVCDKSECYEDGEKDYYDECCYGHYEKDQLLDFVNAKKEKGFGLTNKEVLEMSDPTSEDYSMTYIYEDYSWSHCKGTSDFTSLFSSLYKQSRK